jgi:nucleoside phosphorylase
VTTESTGIVVVLTALETEYTAVRDLIEAPAVRHHASGTQFAVGRVPGCDGQVALVLAGPGNQPAAVLAERAIAEFRPRALFFSGIAGALHDDLDLGTVVAATKVYGYHGGFEELAGFSSRPQAWDADHELDQIAHAVSRETSWHRDLPSVPAVRFRPIAAGEVILNSRETPLAQQLQRHFGDAAAIEQESAGAARAAHLNRVPFLTVRGISDKADGHKYETDGAGWQSIAARNAAAFTVAVAAGFLSGPARWTVNNSVTPKSIRWSQLTRPVDVGWRTDLTGDRSVVERCAVELHFVPADGHGQLDAQELEPLHGVLAAHGTAKGLFTSTEWLTSGVLRHAAWVRSPPNPDGHSGLAVFRTGQRTAWSPLPYNALGSVVNHALLSERIERWMRLLGEIPGLPAPGALALAAGLEPATGLTETGIGGMPRTGDFCTAPRIRVLSNAIAPFSSLLAHPQEATEEIVDRLLLAIRQAC